MIERVQRTATRIALKQVRGEMSYAERFKVLHWSTRLLGENILSVPF